ncbi:carbohydrate ABC transporter permease [Bifidobacterium aquikefiricola]|uniref:Maltose/maltodextrin transport system permease protein n=1 Tax=Bifidobacterium aquikefiricola TaxID=3059038 RepID=A0AB39U6P9_9BIFI
MSVTIESREIVQPSPKLHKRKKDFIQPSPYSFSKGMSQGNTATRLSLLIFGLGNVAHRQFAKGIMFFALEMGFIYFMVVQGFSKIKALIKLEGSGQTKTKVNGFWVYQAGHPSVVILLYGISSIVLCVVFLVLAWVAVRSAYKAQLVAAENDGKVPSLVQDVRSLSNVNVQTLLMSLPTAGIIIFTVLPLVFMITMAFTSYDSNHVTRFGWVGLQNFARVLGNGAGDVNIQLFMSVLAWTLVWAFFATFLNYFLGMFMAMVINRKGTKLKGFWRASFSMSIAVPQFVSLLVMNTMLQPTGAINRLLQQWGWIDTALPFFTDANWARVTVILINLWVGIPYTIMQVTGILQNIPGELYEAARLDGANSWQLFRNVTMPYMFFVMTPYLITTFTANVNNFNVIYLLSNGDPTPVGASAGKTDLLITWLYKLTVDKSNYNLGAVIGILTFIVLAVVSLVAYRSSGSYKNEEGFQ